MLLRGRVEPWEIDTCPSLTRAGQLRIVHGGKKRESHHPSCGSSCGGAIRMEVGKNVRGGRFPQSKKTGRKREGKGPRLVVKRIFRKKDGGEEPTHPKRGKECSWRGGVLPISLTIKSLVASKTLPGGGRTDARRLGNWISLTVCISPRRVHS